VRYDNIVSQHCAEKRRPSRVTPREPSRARFAPRARAKLNSGGEEGEGGEEWGRGGWEGGNIEGRRSQETLLRASRTNKWTHRRMDEGDSYASGLRRSMLSDRIPDCQGHFTIVPLPPAARTVVLHRLLFSVSSYLLVSVFLLPPAPPQSLSLSLSLSFSPLRSGARVD